MTIIQWLIISWKQKFTIRRFQNPTYKNCLTPVRGQANNIYDGYYNNIFCTYRLYVPTCYYTYINMILNSSLLCLIIFYSPGENNKIFWRRNVCPTLRHQRNRLSVGLAIWIIIVRSGVPQDLPSRCCASIIQVSWFRGRCECFYCR